jgi:hypothetical protein
MVFNGTTGKITTTATVDLRTPFTIEVWTRPPSVIGSYSIFVSNRAPGAYTTAVYLQADGSLQVALSGFSFTTVGRNLFDGQWHHIGVIVTPMMVTVMIDGQAVLLDTTSLPSWPGTNLNVLEIGHDVSASLFGVGGMDEVAIYRYALTPAQIRGHYAANPLSVPYAPGSYPALVLKDGARNYWRLGESSGTSAVDVVGGVNGTISGGVTLGQAGALGDGDKAMKFDGVNGKVQTVGSVTIPVVSTIEAWIKIATGTPNGLVLLDTRVIATGGTVTWYLDASGQLTFASGGAITGLTPVTDGRWHHIAVVMDGVIGTQYIDGVIDNFPPFARVTPSTGSISFGCDQVTAGEWPGMIDEVAVYPLALTPAQITAHYNARTLPYVPGTYPARVIASGPSNYWRLGEASGATAVDLVGGANGTISGGVTLGQKGALSEPDTAMAFDGVDDQIATAAVVALPVSFTAEAWLKCNSFATSQRPVFAIGAGQAPVLYVLASGNVGLFDGGNGVGAGGTLPVADGLWHHVVWVCNGATVAFYIDGVLNVQPPLVRTVPSSGVAGIGFDPAFGGSDPRGQWLGSLDDVAMYPRALPASEILAHYQAKLADMWDPRLYPPTSPPTTGPVAYPAVTSPYPQSGQPSSAPRPAPTLTTLTPSSVAVVAGTPSFQVVTLTGTNFSNASRISLAGVLDQFRVDDTITYRDPTSLQITLDVRGLVAGAYQLGVVNQDSQASATLPFTVS